MDPEQVQAQDHIPEYNPLLTPFRAAEYLSMTPRFLEMRRHRGGGPPFVRISSRAIRYFLSDLREWAEARRRTSTSDPGPEHQADDPFSDQSSENSSPLAHSASSGIGITPPDQALS